MPATETNAISAAAEEALKVEVKQVIVALGDIVTKHFYETEAFKANDFSLLACEIASKITGVDLFLCKMLNRAFRTDGCEMMFERALAEVA